MKTGTYVNRWRLWLLFLSALNGVNGSSTIVAQRIPVIRDSLTPNWTEDGQQLWFQSKLAQGNSLFWLVDAKSGTREPLFDQQLIAKQFEKEAGQSVSAERFPDRVVSYNPVTQTVEVQYQGRTAKINRKTSEVTWSGSAQSAGKLFWPPQPSVESVEPVSFIAHNKLEEPIEILWIDFEGNSISYGTVEPEHSYRTSSYATHVWLFQPKSGERLGCFRLGEEAVSEIEINSAEVGLLQQLLASSVEPFLPAKPSETNGDSVSFSVTNQLEYVIDVFWVDTQSKLIPYSKLKKGESFSTGSYVGHVWLFRSSEETPLACLQLDDRSSTEVQLDQTLLDRVQQSQPQARLTGRQRPDRSRRRGNRQPSANVSFGSTSPSGKFSLEVRDDNLWLITDRSRADAVQLTTDADDKNSFRRSAQAARLTSMQYNAQDLPQRVADAVWSPNSQFVIAWQTKNVTERRVVLSPSNPENYSENELSYPYAKPGDELPNKTLRLFDAERQIEIPVTAMDFSDPWSLGIERFSADGRFVWVNYNERGHQKIQAVRIELKTGNSNIVIHETSPTFLHYSAGSKYRLRWLDETTALWSSERSGWNHLYRIDMNSGEILNAVTTGDWNVKDIQTIRDGKVWFYAVGIDPDQDPYHEHFCRVDLDGTNFVRLTQGDGMHTVTWSPTEEYFIDQYSRVDLPPVHELRSAEGELLCEIERGELLAKESNPLDYLFPRRFVAPGRDGKTPIWGVVHFPVDFSSDESYPVLESIYAGPHDYHVPKRFRNSRSFARFTAAGYVVVQIDGMGTAWRSKAFHDVCYRNLRDAGFPDRIAWIKALASDYPNLDLKRVGIFGGSAGGQNAMAALLWHNDFYKVAVADCGCHDNRMDKIWWNEQWMGKVEPGDHYSENSNLDNAHLLKGKLLLVVGEMDKNVDPASTLDVAAKLTELGKQEHFELLAIPGTGHGAAESRIGQQRRFEFLKEHLLQAD